MLTTGAKSEQTAVCMAHCSLQLGMQITAKLYFWWANFTIASQAAEFLA